MLPVSYLLRYDVPFFKPDMARKGKSDFNYKCVRKMVINQSGVDDTLT